MCLLFVYINPNPTPDSYAVIVANTRDEVFGRPTKPAGPWLPDHPHCVGGIDLERPGYGTWLATSDAGKIASLLNVLEAGRIPNAISRGELVSDFVTSDMDAVSYLESLQSGDAWCERYNAFKLVLLEKRDIWEMYSLSNASGRGIQTYHSGIHAFCNSTEDERPWKKAVYGKVIFESIVGQSNAVDKEDTLVHSLFQLLADRKNNAPDDILEKQGAHLRTVHPGRLEELHHINVLARKPDYGSRTRTVILIDQSGSSKYIERTMKEPINADKPEWLQTTTHQQLTQHQTE